MKKVFLLVILLFAASAGLYLYKYVLPIKNNSNATPPIETQNSAGTEMYMISNVYEENGIFYADLDSVAWFSDQDNRGVTTLNASKECLNDGACKPEGCKVDQNIPCVMNGYYIKNSVEEFRKYEFNSDAQIELIDLQNPGLRTITPREFKELFEQVTFTGKSNPYIAEIVDNNIVKLVQQYIP